MTHYYTRFVQSLLLLCFLSIVIPSTAQINFTAKDEVKPYNGRFKPGSNLGYLPLGWSNQTAADLLAGDPSKGIPGVGARSLRPSLASYVLEELGDEIELESFQHYFNIGINDLTAFVGEPSDAHRDHTQYCPGVESTLFKNLYKPIWDGGANGTPVNDENDFALYMYQVVVKYNDYVKFWEIWNEAGYSDSDKAWRPKGFPGNWWDNNPSPCDYKLKAPIQHYVRTLRIAYEVIKYVAPEDYVVMAGPGYPSFLDVIMRNTDNPDGGKVSAQYPNKGGAYFDVFGLHSYPSIDGSLRHWDDNTQDWAYMRNSDEAARQVIDDRYGQYKEVLFNYGYNGGQYPKKLLIVTETNVPRIKFTEESLASDAGQVNFLMKSAITNKVNDFVQMHVYSIDDLAYEGNIANEFDCMGFYKKFQGEPQNQVRNNSGIGFKTMADFITETDYDQARTGAMNLPADVKGFAFKKQDGTYLYALWAKTLVDNSEYASKNYSFPSNFNINQVKQSQWDASLTNASTTIAGSNINLTGSVSFYEPIPTTDQPPSVVLATPKLIVTESFVVTATFSENVTGMDASKLTVTNAYVTGMSGSGTTYTFVVKPVKHGPLKVSLESNKAFDSANQPNMHALPLHMIYQYCQPKGNVTYAWIKSVRLNYLTKYSHKRPYKDFTEVNFTLDKSKEIPVKVTAQQNPNRAGFFRAWIDFDQDGLYDEDEIAFQGQTSSNGQLYSSFYVPSDALAGKTRMRVMFSLDDYPSSPCADIANGEVEDYSATIVGQGGQNNCQLYVTQHEKICDNMGTPIKSWDDQFTISMTVNGMNASGSWEATVKGQKITGPYNQPVDFGPYVIHENEFTIQFKDGANGSCTTSTFVEPPHHCSNFEGVDTKGYCIPQSQNPWGEWINNVTLGSINNTSFRKPYSDFSYVSTDVQRGQDYPLSLTSGFGYYTHNEYWRVWIDYNQNGVFEPSERAFQQMVPKPSNGTFENTINGSIHIPSSAKSGATIMRVIMSRNGYAYSCENIAFGEIEDYTINIQGTTPPAVLGCSQLSTPANNATNIPLSSILEWTQAENATGYKVSIGTTSGGHEIVNQLNVGNSTSHQFSPFPHKTKIFVKVFPYTTSQQNESCPVMNFTTIDTTTGGGGGGGNGSCPTELAGYDFLGEHNSHNYFISSTKLNWQDAKVAAENQAGQLVVINDAAENSFIQSNISDIAFIGLSDNASEGDFVWVDNADMSYTNYSNCSWCADNNEMYDYYTIFPWDGEWSLDNQWAKRLYIVEFACSDDGGPGDGGGTTDKVDLILTLEADDYNPGQWSHVTMHLTVENTSSATAHNVIVQFYDQSNADNRAMLGYSSDNDPAGTNFHDWSGQWDIPVIEAGASYTLEYVGFTKVPANIPVFSQVIACDEEDDDSTPNNSTVPYPVEDDEAAILINPFKGKAANFGGGANMITSKNASLQVQEGLEDFEVYPNPANDYVMIDLPLNVVVQIQIINSLGQKVYSKKLDEGHERTHRISIADFPKGSFFIQVNGLTKKLLKE